MPTNDTFDITPQSGTGNNSSETKKKRDQRSRKRVPISIALRKQGIDEHTIAETCAYTLDALKGIIPVKDGDKKLLIDFVKECTKLLGGDAQTAPSAPLRVRLVHKVARPQRAEAGTSAAESEPTESALALAIAEAGEPN
ncbi:MAG: hypothetical protein ACRD8A_09715 [Candidatus Acidiferrales bacterium]